MSLHKLISLTVIAAFILPSSLSAVRENHDIESQHTSALLAQAIPGRPVFMDAGDGETFLLQPGGMVPLKKYQELERQYKSSKNGVLIAVAGLAVGTALFVVSLMEGWLKVYTDCKE